MATKSDFLVRAGLTVSSNATVGGTVNAAALNISGPAVIAGNLTISGSTTYVNGTIISTTDLNMLLANGVGSAALANGAGLIIGTYANIVYSSGASGWQSNVNIVPAANNLLLGNTTSLWNVNANTVSAANLSVSTISAATINTTGKIYSNSSIQSAYVNVNPQTSNYTLANSDSGTIITIANNGGSVTITVPSSLQTGFRTMVTKLGSANVVVGNAAGVTLGSRSGAYTVANTYGSVSIYMANTSLAIIDGAI